MQLIREDYGLSRLDTYANATLFGLQIVRTTLSFIFSLKLIHLSSLAAFFSHCCYPKLTIVGVVQTPPFRRVEAFEQLLICLTILEL